MTKIMNLSQSKAKIFITTPKDINALLKNFISNAVIAAKADAGIVHTDSIKKQEPLKNNIHNVEKGLGVPQAAGFPLYLASFHYARMPLQSLTHT